MTRLPFTIKLLAWVIAILTFIILGIYFTHFEGSLGDNNVFGTFGDFIGGTLNPLLSFFTIVLLIWSIRFQTDELSLSRQELVKSSKALDAAQLAHNENVKLQKREILRKQVHDAFEHHWNRYQSLLSSTMASSKILTATSTGAAIQTEAGHSLNDFLNGDKNKVIVEFVQSIPQRINTSEPYNRETILLRELIAELDFMTLSAQSLLKLVDSEMSAHTIQRRVTSLISQCQNIRLIDEQNYQKMNQRLNIPENQYEQ